MKRWLAAALVGVTIGSLVTPVLVAEATLRMTYRPRPDAAEAASLARATASSWENARVIAADGAPLDGWLFTPRTANGSDVMVLHGVGDSRAGMFAHADFLLRAGFVVLLPDSRGHGASGGSIVTYGIRESDDIHRWADWLLAGVRVTYTAWESHMGAAILLESLPREPRFRAVVADCPSTASKISPTTAWSTPRTSATGPPGR